MNPPAEFWRNSVIVSSWQDVRLPSHAIPQGVILPRDGQYVFKKSVSIPPEFAGKRIFLQFDGVSGEGKVWVNETFVRDHYGAFTTWDCDITDLVKPGAEAWITVTATDARDGLSEYNNGGILRPVRLMALPQDHLIRFNVDSDLFRNYTEGLLKVWVAMRFHRNTTARIELVLRDPFGKTLLLNPSGVELTKAEPETVLEIPVRGPVKWDAEHPNLYTLEARVMGPKVWSKSLSEK